MNLDVRLPMGMMFTILGAMLAVYGLLSPEQVYARSLGIDVNLWWGLVLLAFGLVVLWLAFRARAKQGGPGREDGGR
jgi:ABC-type Fe3+-siderophore transport system permease subunit